VSADAVAPGAPAGGGRVYLVGAGPGDPGLLTLRGRDLLGLADVVVYDRLVHPALLDLCRPDCERVFAGKAPGEVALEQADIQATLIAAAARGRCVVRLKGGDPFVFGRGGEEAQALAAAGVPFEVVPGVTSAVAAPACAGIPVTHRGVASSFAVVTGHRRADAEEGPIDWSAYGRQPDTLVVLMGRAALGEIAAALCEAGRPRDTPCAVISSGTLPEQRTVTAPLEGIAAAADAAGLGSPALLVVGEVVRLRSELAWFERRPLAGRRVVVTRTREQGSELAAALRRLGAEPVELPVLAIAPPADAGDLEAAAADIASCWWLCFTSANAVEPFFAALRRAGRDTRALCGTRVACVGPATARSLAAHGVVPDVVPARASAAGLLEALGPQVRPGQRVLFVRGEPAADTLAAGLRALGLEVREAVAYRALPDGRAAGRARELLDRGADAVTFASSATVGHFLAAAGEEGRRLCERAAVVCIGPETAAAAQSLGLGVRAVAPEPSVAGLLQAVLGIFSVAEPAAREPGAVAPGPAGPGPGEVGGVV
jgi:uroporphyrinogen III methyltransferase/synthase